ncbi:MAG TPA: hypothetical protein VK638_26085 [Edaphobacter sp.]|nr:hypothetical protein [Edaphobacter sp.]
MHYGFDEGGKLCADAFDGETQAFVGLYGDLVAGFYQERSDGQSEFEVSGQRCRSHKNFHKSFVDEWGEIEADFLERQCQHYKRAGKKIDNSRWRCCDEESF